MHKQYKNQCLQNLSGCVRCLVGRVLDNPEVPDGLGVISMSVAVAPVMSEVGSLTVGVSMESAAELDPLEFPDVEPSSVKFGATGNK